MAEPNPMIEQIAAEGTSGYSSMESSVRGVTSPQQSEESRGHKFSVPINPPRIMIGTSKSMSQDEEAGVDGEESDSEGVPDDDSSRDKDIHSRRMAKREAREKQKLGHTTSYGSALKVQARKYKKKTQPRISFGDQNAQQPAAHDSENDESNTEGSASSGSRKAKKKDLKIRRADQRRQKGHALTAPLIDKMHELQMPSVERGHSYRSIRSIQQDSVDEGDELGSFLSPRRQSVSRSSERAHFHEVFQSLIRAGTDSKAKRADTKELTMRGRRNSEVSFDNLNNREKHPMGQVLWLHLQAYLHLSADEFRTKSDIMWATQAFDNQICAERERQKSVLSKIRHFHLDTVPADSEGRAQFTIADGEVNDSDAEPGLLSPQDALLPPVSNNSAQSPDKPSDSETLDNKAYLDSQRVALRTVGELLHEYERFERLYPTTTTMKDMLGQHEFDTALIERINVLYVWYNTTRDINGKIRDVGEMLLGLKKRPTVRGRYEWPLLDYESPRVSEDERDESSECESEVEGDGSRSTMYRSPAVSYVSTENLDKDAEMITQASTYKVFVERSLRLRGMRKVLLRIDKMEGNTLAKARRALERSSSYADVVTPKQTSSNIKRWMPLTPDPWAEDSCASSDCVPPSSSTSRSSKRTNKSPSASPESPKNGPSKLFLKQVSKEHKDLSKFGVYHVAFSQMGLPSFYPSFLYLLRIPLNLVHEWLKVRVEKPTSARPDPLTLDTLIQDCHDCLEAAVEVKTFYQEYVQATTSDEDALDRLLLHDLKVFEDDLGNMFKIYLDYVLQWGQAQSESMTTTADWSQGLIQRLEVEWKFAKRIAISVLSGESECAERFCLLSKNLFESMVERDLRNRYDEVTDEMFEIPEEDDDDLSQSPQPSPELNDVYMSNKKNSRFYVACRTIKKIISDTRERALRALTFAKLLGNDLEISAKFERLRPLNELLDRLYETEHVLVCPQHDVPDYMMFCESKIAENDEHLQLLLNVTCGRDDHEVPKHLARKPGYLLLVRCETREEKKEWKGQRKHISPDPDTNMALQYMQVDAVYLVVVNSKSLPSMRRAMRQYIPESSGYINAVEEQCSCHEIIASHMKQLKECAMKLRDSFASIILEISKDLCEEKQFSDLDDNERQSYRNTLIQAYNFAFEYHRELSKLVSRRFHAPMAVKMCEFVGQWCDFVKQACDRGHQSYPRWSHSGLTFLCLASDPMFTETLSSEKYNELKELMNSCVDHIIGTGASTGQMLKHSDGISVTQPVGVDSDMLRAVADQSNRRSFGSQSEQSVVLPASVSPSTSTHKAASAPSLYPNAHGFERSQKIRQKLKQFEDERQNMMLAEHRVGRCVPSDQRKPSMAQIGGTRVPFRWQRLERKLGRGKFGEVYLAINPENNHLMAMKQCKYERRDHRMVKALIDETQNLQRIKHSSLVRYYGVEVHRDELLIFMEYCNEGTLEKVCREGLDDHLVRRYTHYLLKGVQYMHERNIVHRDIKPANIFLCSGDEVLKLGDFGSSVRLSRSTTVKGELTEYVGTPAYMAPEVCTNGKVEDALHGYGRAADIWSLGCVVLEMATGKPPWHECDHPMQILFKAGNGHTPTVPARLGDNCKNFLAKCFAINPTDRATAEQLLGDPFVLVMARGDSVSDSR